MEANFRRSVQLGDLFTIKHGYAFKGEHFGNEGSHIVLTPGNFFDEGGFKNKGDKEKWYSGKIPEEYILSQGDLLVAMTEQAEGLLGSAALVPENDRYLHNQRLGLIQNLNGVEKRFLYYLFNSQPVRQQIRASCSGVKVRHTSPSRIYEVKVDIPPLPTQRKIAAILSAYDDLMANNLRRIKILEEVAKNLYREWFVKFRFPGHQHIRFTDSPLGKIPEGWEAVPLASVVDFAKGRKPVQTRKEPISGDIPLLLIDALHGGDPQFTAPAKLVIAQTRDTFMVIDGASSCEVAQGFSGAVGSTLGRFRTTKPDRFSPHALYHFLEEKADEFKSKNIGAAIPHANKDYILNQMIPLPPQTIALGFHNYLEPIQGTIEILKAKNTTLRRIRDLLLPRLISGEVDVSELEITIPEEVNA